MAENETPEEFRARMLSIGHIRGGRTKTLEKVITRPEHDSSGNQIDSGRKAKVTISEERDIVYTTSENRQDVNVFGSAATIGNAEGA